MSHYFMTFLFWVAGLWEKFTAEALRAQRLNREDAMTQGLLCVLSVLCGKNSPQRTREAEFSQRLNRRNLTAKTQ
jgi:hypothetical protein